MWSKSVYLVLVLFLPLLTDVSSQCSVNIREKIPAKDPVYLTKTGGLWAPSGSALKWSPGEESLLVCSGTSNSMTINKQVTSTITCSANSTFNVGGSSSSSATADSSTLQCANTITGDFQATGQSCGKGAGSLINLGFNTKTFGFTTYIQSCYDMVTGSVRYTRHVIPGAAINFAVIEAARPSFKSSSTAAHVNPAVSYTQAVQLARFTELLGSTAEAEKYFNSTSYLARGHLTPDGDGIFRSWAFATYFYTNAAPEWQVVNAGNWLRVENAARSKAGAMQVDLEIFTGTFDILTLSDINGNPVKISLESGGNIEVPKWFWKIIRDPKSDSGIALVTLNNPFATSISDSEKLCKDICTTSGWNVEAYNLFNKGYTYCCAVGDLLDTISFIPIEANVTNVMRF